MAELLVGGAFLSAFLQVLFDRLAPKEIPKLFHGKQSIVDVLGDVRSVVRSVTRLVDDAEEKIITNNEVSEWLDELKDVVYRADDLVDTINTEAQRLELEPHQPCCLSIVSGLFTTGFADMVKNEATEICDKFKSLLDQKDNLGLRDGLGELPSFQRPPTPLAEESTVYGRKDDKEVIVDLLLSSDGSEEKLSVISIVGMGGIGKTTLAQLVYDDARVKDRFDLRVWVTVSDDFDSYKITKIILEKVTSQEFRIRELLEIQRKLRDSLRGKKFLMVFDDVWNENYLLWDCLKSSFESGAEGCKIIVTTRSTIVASLMAIGKTTTYHLADLSTEDCWLLFSRHAFINEEDAHAHQDLQATGREIVKKCKGLPLAIKSLGGLLRSERNPKNWESILKSDMWNELYRKEKNILPALWLSYRRMPTHLKRCFSYCSIFPKDYEFERERIIMLWMAEGFLQSHKKAMTMEEVGEEYLEDLVSRSMFQKSSQDDSIFLMHDLVHDLAMFVSRGFCYRLEESRESLPRHTRHLSHSLKRGLRGRCDAKYLRTFIGSTEHCYNGWPYKTSTTSGRYLRVVGISGSVSNSIKNLIHLRYLDLSHTWTAELPASICSLYNLQTLLLLKCWHLKTLPKNMERLINLRHLDIYGTSIKEMNFQIKNMKALMSLSHIVIGRGDTGINIKEVKQVQPFMGRLEILRVENVGDASEALVADLKDKTSITDLRLIWSEGSTGDANSSERDRKILDSLQPYTSLRILSIEFYRGTKFPDWVGHDSFSNIVEIKLKNCKRCCTLPPLGQLARLVKLEIQGFNSVVSVGDELYGSSTCGSSFRSLEELCISDMAQLKEWSFGADGTLVFPQLTSLLLQRCPELKMILQNTNLQSPLPDACPDSLLQLKKLSISYCKKLSLSLCRWDLHRLSSLEWLYISNWEGASFPGDGTLLPTTLIEIHIQNSWNMSALNGEAFRQLTNLKKLLIGSWDGNSFPGDGILLPNTLTEITIENSRNLAALNGEAFQQLTNLKELKMNYCPRLQCLPQEGLPASLSALTIEQCHPLLEKRCKKVKGEDRHKIAHIRNVWILTGTLDDDTYY